MKQVMKVEMFGDVLAIYQKPGAEYEFKVYRISGSKIWLDEFESFQEAWTYVEMKLFSGF